jgi:hypothetical protein
MDVPSVPDRSPSEAEIVITNLKKYKLADCDQILAEQIQARGETLWFQINKYINSVWNKEELPDQWK